MASIATIQNNPSEPLIVTIQGNPSESRTLTIPSLPVTATPTDPSFYKYAILKSVNFDLQKKLGRILLIGGASKEIKLSDHQIWQLQSIQNDADLLNRLQRIVYPAFASPEDAELCRNARLELYRTNDLPAFSEELVLIKQLEEAYSKLNSETKKIRDSNTNSNEIKNVLVELNTANRWKWEAYSSCKSVKKHIDELILQEDKLDEEIDNLEEQEDSVENRVKLKKLQKQLKVLDDQVDKADKEVEKCYEEMNKAESKINLLCEKNKVTQTIPLQTYNKYEEIYNSFYENGCALVDKLNKDQNIIILFIKYLTEKEEQAFISFLKARELTKLLQIKPPVPKTLGTNPMKFET